MTLPQTLSTLRPIKGWAPRGLFRDARLQLFGHPFSQISFDTFPRISFNSVHHYKLGLFLRLTGTWLQRFWMRQSTWDTSTRLNVLISTLWDWSTGRLHAAVIVEVCFVFTLDTQPVFVLSVLTTESTALILTSALFCVIRYPRRVPAALLWSGPFWPFNRGDEKVGVWPKATTQHPKLVAELWGIKIDYNKKCGNVFEDLNLGWNSNSNLLQHGSYCWLVMVTWQSSS